MKTLASIRERLKEQETKNEKSSNYGDNTIYPFWNIPSGETVTIRFLPDGNEDNDFFWIERAMFKLPFAGIVGDPDSKPCQVQVPCMEMYGESCSVLNEVRAWFKDPSLEDVARKYWKKRSYVFQGFRTTDPLKEENPPENPIRKFVIGPQIFKVIKASLMDPDMDDLPTDYTHGLDFRLTKTESGSGFADYSTSNWARKTRPLSDEEMNAIDTYGLFNLQDTLPKKPSELEQKIIFEMFEASVNGEAYDPTRWSEYYKPFGVQITEKLGDKESSSNMTSQSVKKTDEPKSNPQQTLMSESTNNEDIDEPSVENTNKQDKPSSNNKAEDILKMIRSRQTS